MTYIGYNFKIKQDIANKDYQYLINCFDKVIKDGWNAIQIYLGDKRKTTMKYKFKLNDIEKLQIHKYLKEHDLLLVIHSILTINLCNPPDSMMFRWGVDNLIFDILNCIQLGGFGVVIHLGRVKTTKINISIEEGINNYVNSLIYVIGKVIETNKKTNKKFKIIIETNNAQKNTIGGTVEELSIIYNKIPLKYRPYIFFCVDLQHIFTGGYNLRNTNIALNYFKTFDILIGKNKIKLIHLDDSRTEFNSHINRHAPLEEGYIFNKGKEGNPTALSILLNLFFKKKYNIIIETDCDHKREKKLIEKYIKHNIKYFTGGSLDYNKVIMIFKELRNYYETMGKQANEKYIFKASSYDKAIKSLEKQGKNKIKTVNNIKNLNGFGKSMQLKIIELLETGKLESYQKIIGDKTYQAAKIFNKIYGIGPEKAFELISKNIYTLDELRERVKKDKTLLNDKQLIGLRYYDEMNERIPREEITYFTKYFQKLLDSEYNKSVKVNNAGSYYMGKETSGDIDLILVSKDKYDIKIKHLYQILEDNDNLMQILSAGKNKTTCLIIYNYKQKERIRQLDLALIDEDQYPWYILYFGSGKEFSKKIRGVASKKGYRLNEKGIFDKKSGKQINFYPKNEKDIFDFLGIEYQSPNKR
jgi:DNA polymerase beta